jgi:tRNA-specific 2-thiouridylase
MPGKRKKVVVAMSGGVDSSVAACLLVEQGYDVIGLFMRVGVHEPATEGETSVAEAQPAPRSRRGCCSAGDAQDARAVAGKFGISFYALNFEREFDRLIEEFADEYVRGRTPNPCIICNDRLKFGKLADYAEAVGARYIATGHYARIGTRDGRRVLMRGRDPQKDQSYVLFGLGRDVLDRVIFPVGELTKDEVRQIAARYGLANRDKADSVEICFAPDRDYARIVHALRPDAFVEGDVLDQDGCVIGRHQGIARYTIGQRRGLGIAAGKPIYVTRLDAGANTVTMGDNDALLAPALVADRVHLLADVPDGPLRAHVKIRYLHHAAPATIERLAGDKVRVVFDEPQRAVTPGQAVVFYDGDVVLGGAWIERAETASVAADD